MLRLPYACAIVAACCSIHAATANPAFVAHSPASGVFAEPASITQREPLVPREGDVPQLWIKVGPSFTYDRVAVYYTTDGSVPEGERGAPLTPQTKVLLSFVPPSNQPQSIFFVRNEPGQNGNDDWWRAQFPSSAPENQFGTRIRYKVSAWSIMGTDVFAGVGPQVYEWTNKIAWPGAGFGEPDPAVGYPPYHIWKEEGVVGNNSINVMIDQNGSVYDIYYPSVGAVQGISTENEGYDDGNRDEFPSCLVPGQRGQMHMNNAMLGLRVNGVTYWLSNRTGTAFNSVMQDYIAGTNLIASTSRLQQGGADLSITQIDFSPKGVAFPTDGGGNPNKGIFLKRAIITNNGAAPQTVDAYYYADWAINGGDGFDGSFTDAARGAMIGYDNAFRIASNGNGCGFGDYNPTTFPSYTKNVSVYLAAAMKVAPAVGAAGGDPASDFWSDTSADQGLGWIARRVTIAPGESKELNIAIVGGFDAFASATGTYAFQVENAIDWFLNASVADLQSQTETYWTNWLAQGVQFISPDPTYNDNYARGLLGTALHLDEKNGGIIAGMHNGAYPYVWPRDAAWAAITLARTGYLDEAKDIFRFLRDVAFRDVEGWGRKGFWKQKYTTDGYTAWGNPQVDETSCYPWCVRFIYDVTGETTFLEEHYDEVYEAALASSQDSTVDGRLRYEEGVSLVYSMNLWEDLFDVTIYSNASVVRGLEDAAAIADILNNTSCPGGPNMCGYHTDRDLFNTRAAAIRGGLDARLEWNGENTDISHAGIVYPMNIYPPGHPRAELVFDRFNGVATDRFGNNHPIVQFGAVPEWTGLINRYWGDGYWNGGPWFLSTLWYGAYYALRNDFTPGKGDIDNFKFRFDRTLAFLGDLGFGAEQMARNSTTVYPDFFLQTAYPNAWESMSFLVDATMLFLDWTPDADSNILRLEPKLPSAWPFMEYQNLSMGPHRIDIRVEETPDGIYHIFRNRTGLPLECATVLRIPVGGTRCFVAINGVSAPHVYNAALGAVTLQGAIAPGAGAVTTAVALTRLPSDVNRNGVVDFGDITTILGSWGGTPALPFASGDASGDGVITFTDITVVLSSWGQACP